MSLAVVTVVVVIAVAALIAGIYVTAKKRTSHLGDDGSGPASSDIVSGLLSELRKWQAEAAYWKSTAERLQRELDSR